VLLFAPQHDNGVLLGRVHRTVGNDFDEEIDNVEGDIELLLRLVAAQQQKQQVRRAVNGRCCKMLHAQIEEGFQLSTTGRQCRKRAHSIQCTRTQVCTRARVRLPFPLHFHSTNQHDADLFQTAAQFSSESVLSHRGVVSRRGAKEHGMGGLAAKSTGKRESHLRLASTCASMSRTTRFRYTSVVFPFLQCRTSATATPCPEVRHRKPQLSRGFA
jgi:hypothetical protein